MNYQNNNFQEFWLKKASFVCWQTNFAWLLTYFLPFFLFFSFALSIALILFKKFHLALIYLALPALILFIVISLFLFVVARKKFISIESALVQLEIHLKLNNALTTAYQEKIPWIDSKFYTSSPMKWLKLRIALPLAISVLTIFVAIATKIKDPLLVAINAVELPLSIKKTEELIEPLKNSELIEEKKLEELEKKLEELKNKAPEQLYEHGNLEAADNLREQLQNSIENLNSSLDKAEQLIEEFQDKNSELSAEEKQNFQDKLKQLKKELESGGLNLDPKKLKQLEDALGNNPKENAKDLESFGNEISKLKESLEKKGLGNKGVGKEKENSTGKVGEGKNGKDGKEEMQNGPSRGPGTEPLDPKEKPPQITSNFNKQLKGKANQPKDLGELLTVEPMLPDTAKSNTQSDGGAFNAQNSEKAISKSNLTPAEKKVLKNYFK